MLREIKTDSISEATLNAAVGLALSLFTGENNKDTGILHMQILSQEKLSCLSHLCCSFPPLVLLRPHDIPEHCGTQSCCAPDRDGSGFKAMSELSPACLCSLPFLKQSCCGPRWQQPRGSCVPWARIQPRPHSIYVLMSCSKPGTQPWCTANFLPFRPVSDSWSLLLLSSACLTISERGFPAFFSFRCPVSLWPFQTTPVTQRS